MNAATAFNPDDFGWVVSKRGGRFSGKSVNYPYIRKYFDGRGRKRMTISLNDTLKKKLNAFYGDKVGIAIDNGEAIVLYPDDSGNARTISKHGKNNSAATIHIPYDLIDVIDFDVSEDRLPLRWMLIRYNGMPCFRLEPDRKVVVRK